MNVVSRTLLILLRIAIGWHFLVEGIDKVESMRRGPTETSRPFSSAGYLNEASGPVSPYIKDQIGDPEKAALERLTPQAVSAEAKAPAGPGSQYLSATLVNELEDYFKHFGEYYGFANNPGQREKARSEFEKAKDKAGMWLVAGGKDVDKSFSRADFKAPMTTKDRVEEYKKKLAKVQEMQERELPIFNKDVEKARLAAAKAEVAKLRNELLADLKQPIEEALRDSLTKEQKEMPPMQSDSGKTWAEYSKLEWIDRIVSWGLVVVGACLILGLFTRLSACAGAAFLLMLYLSMPPLPWLPEPSRVEGHYVYVNKNLIEMLALLVLATTRTGYWIGLDGLLSRLNPFRKRRVAEA